jgi:hypothetical protein
MADKLYSVKAFQDVEIESIMDQKGNKTKVKRYSRKLVVVGHDLTWEKAQEVRKQYSKAGASIFPNVKTEELKVIKLG